MAASYLNSFWRYLCSSFSLPRMFLYTARGTKDSKESFKTETAKSKKSAHKRPSFFLFLSFSSLSMALWIAIQSKAEPENPIVKKLQTVGWKQIENADCVGNGFFELDSNGDSIEIYKTEESIFASKINLPEKYHCRKINEPSLITEIE